MDAFFAAVELLRRPELRGKPVVVGGRGDPTQRGVVSTASYEARRYGIHSGLPLRTAANRCRDAVFLPVDFSAYTPVSKRVKAVLREFSPIVQDMGIDEAFADVTDSPLGSRELGVALKKRVREETQLTCSIGIAPNKLLAKMASDLEKPDGLTVLHESDVPARIWPLPARALRGVGPKTERALLALGLKTIGAIAAAPVERLVERFGPAHGEHLHRAAHGHGTSELSTSREPKSHSRETTFQQDVREREVLEEKIDQLARSVARDLAERGYAAKNVAVKLRYANFDTRTRATTLTEPTNDPDLIGVAARRCLGRFELGRPVRLLGVRAGVLVREGESDDDLVPPLFAGAPPHREEDPT